MKPQQADLRDQPGKPIIGLTPTAEILTMHLSTEIESRSLAPRCAISVNFYDLDAIHPDCSPVDLSRGREKKRPAMAKNLDLVPTIAKNGPQLHSSVCVFIWREQSPDSTLPPLFEEVARDRAAAAPAVQQQNGPRPARHFNTSPSCAFIARQARMRWPEMPLLSGGCMRAGQGAGPILTDTCS